MATAEALPRRREIGPSSARSLLLTVLGEYVLPSGEPVWTGTLVAALGLLGVAEKAARQALARTAAEGWIASSRHGRLARWQLTAAGRRLLTDGAQRIYSFGQDGEGWDGRVADRGRARGRPRRPGQAPDQDQAHLGRASARCPAACGSARNPAREAEASQILAELGLAEAAMSFTARHGSIGAQQDIVARAWDLRAVEARYAEFIAEFAGLRAGDRRRDADRPDVCWCTSGGGFRSSTRGCRATCCPPDGRARRLPRSSAPGTPGGARAASRCWSRLAANERVS